MAGQDPWLRTDPWLHYTGTARFYSSPSSSPTAGDASARASGLSGQPMTGGAAKWHGGSGTTSSGTPGHPFSAVGNFATSATPVAAPRMSPSQNAPNAQMTGHPGLFSQPLSLYPQGNPQGMNHGGIWPIRRKRPSAWFLQRFSSAWSLQCLWSAWS